MSTRAVVTPATTIEAPRRVQGPGDRVAQALRRAGDDRAPGVDCPG
jgi:hypothetical protein